MRRGQWIRAGVSPDRKSFALEKATIAKACQALIDGVLKPHFLPEVRPTKFNYPIDICGRWHGTNYRFIQRYRSGYDDNAGWEFDAPFTRLEYVARDRFNLSFFRHTGQWHLLHRGVSLSEALRLIESDGHLHPL
jgi:hypothetical protein